MWCSQEFSDSQQALHINLSQGIQTKCWYLSLCCSQSGKTESSCSLISTINSEGSFTSQLDGSIKEDSKEFINFWWMWWFRGRTSTTLSLFITLLHKGHLILWSLKYKYRHDVQIVCPQWIIILGAFIARSYFFWHIGQYSSENIFLEYSFDLFLVCSERSLS